MPKKLTVLAAMLTVVLVAAVPAFAQEEPVQEDGSSPPDTGLQPQPAVEEPEPGEADQSVTVAPAPGPDCAEEVPQYESPTPPPEVAADGSNYSACSAASEVSNFGILQSAASETQEESGTGALKKSAPACGTCGLQVAQAAKDILTGGSAGPSPREAFGVALEAAREAGNTREALASDESPEGGVEETAAYQAAFAAAKKAGADDETARDAALRALAELPAEDEAGAPEEEARKNESSKYDTRKNQDLKRAARKDGIKKRDTAGEETTANEEVADSGGDTGVTHAPERRSAPLIMGGGVLLVTGLFMALRARP